jgi:DNA phosphorothioation-associated putative methyltransferase
MQTSEDAKYHRTAMARKSESLGLKTARKIGCLINAEGDDAVVLDYGCGRGDDVRILATEGYDATGYDPNLPMGAPYGLMRDAPVGKGTYDLVLLTFVLNVIEEFSIRQLILHDAFEYVRPGGTLLVTVRHDGDAKPTPAWTRKRDGWVTSTGTFQRFFKKGEVPFLLEGLFGRKAIVAPIDKNVTCVTKFHEVE